MTAASIECATLSRLAGEPLSGTAAVAEVFVGLEEPGPWGRKGAADLDASPELRAWLVGLEAGPRPVRVQLLRRPDRPAQGPRILRVAGGEPGSAWARGLELELAALVGLDPAAVLAGAAGAAIDRPMVWVCTHGRRDPCCARLGGALYRACEGLADLELWQTSHLGGHRFAPTLVILPEGVCYGRLEPDEVGELMAAHRDGRIHRLDRYRGRCRHPEPAQAAEHALRERLGDLRLGSFAEATVDELASDRRRVSMHDADGASHVVELVRAVVGALRPASCGAEPELPSSWRAESITSSA